MPDTYFAPQEDVMSTGSPKINFPGMLGGKRRRMRSGGNVSTLTNNTPRTAAPPEENATKPEKSSKSKCKEASTIPIFLKKTYKMIETSPPEIADWTEDGDMFVVKDPESFASTIIPQYFDHNKFSSFARQLNFYGFRKMQTKPLRNSDYDAGTAKHVTFHNENFKRGRCDLLKNIQRSTRGSANSSNQDQQKEVQALKEQVATLERKLEETTTEMEERMRRLELDMLGRMEQMMLAMQQQQQTQIQLQQTAGTSKTPSPAPALQNNQAVSNDTTWEPTAIYNRGISLNSFSNDFVAPAPLAVAGNTTSVGDKPTLPPHPKQKQLPLTDMPPSMGLPPSRLTSLRGLSRGISSLSRGQSVESNASAVLLRSSWEDKFFSMLMAESDNPATAGKLPNNNMQQQQQLAQAQAQMMANQMMAVQSNAGMDMMQDTDQNMSSVSG